MDSKLTVERKKWSENFSEWFHDVIERAENIDYRYPIKGCGVWLAYGLKFRNNIVNIIRQLLDQTGHEEMMFPILIPEDLLAKEATHIRSFEDEAYWITHGGTTPLDIKLALRPTSETAITPMVKLWVRSHADLPKKVFQVGSIFRYETKATRPLIRVREVTTFKEAHTFHATHEEAEAQVMEAVKIYSQFLNELNLPFVVSRRPDWDKFAGANYSIAFDTVFPDGRTLQIGTVHDLGQNFSKPFEVSYEKKDGTREYAWSTSYGISERAIAAVITVHGDDRGLVLPPKIAPIQVIVVPIPYKGMEDKIYRNSKEVVETLKAAGFRAEIDLRDEITPGSKFYNWELRGVPIRIEIGPEDVKRAQVTIARRDILEKVKCPKKELVKAVQDLSAKIEEELKNHAWRWLRDHIQRAENLKEAQKMLAEEKGIIEIPWCEDNDCGLKIEEEVNARILGIPLTREKIPFMKCPICGRTAKNLVRLGKAY